MSKYDMSEKIRFVINPGITCQEMPAVYFDTLEEAKIELQEFANDLIDERRLTSECYEASELEYVDVINAKWEDVGGVLWAKFDGLDWDVVHIWL